MFQDEDDEKKHNWVPLDESVKCTMIWNMNKLPMLYIDDYTVLEEISDLSELRKGDHCLVPLNPIRKLLGSYFDAFVFLTGSLGILKLYVPSSHHHLVPLQQQHKQVSPFHRHVLCGSRTIRVFLGQER